MDIKKVIIQDKIIHIFSFLLIIFSLAILITTDSTKIYEISVYSMYPWFFWFSIVTPIFIGQILILKNIFFYSFEKESFIWIIALLEILMPILILLFIPFIRGYPTYGTGDHLTHIGEVKDILYLGAISENNFYPNLHILTSISTLTTDSGVINNANITSRWLFFLVPISLFLFYRIILDNKNEVKFAMLLSSVFLFFAGLCRYLAPYDQTFLLLPLILYLYFKRKEFKKRTNITILFTIILVSYTFYHPLDYLLLILVFLVLALVFYISPKIDKLRLTQKPPKVIKEKSFNVFHLAVLLFLTWYFSFSYIVGSFYRIFNSIFRGIGESPFEAQSSVYSSFSPALFDTLRIIFFNFGFLFIIYILSLFSLIILLIKWFKNKNNFELSFILSISLIIFFILSTLIGGSIFFDLLVDWYRFMIWALIFFVIINSIVLYNFISQEEFKYFRKKLLILGLCFFLIFALFISISTFYRSPLTADVNLQVTHMDWEGASWIYKHNNSEFSIDELGIYQWRFYSAIFGVRSLSEESKFNSPPDHFNYDTNITFGGYYSKTRYLIITHLAKIRYPISYPNYREFWRFTPDDFKQLQQDFTVNEIYTNKGFEGFYVN